VKVYLLEAVDPEDRKLRQRKLLAKSRSLHRGHISALQAGDKQSAEKLFIRSMRAKYIAQRDKPSMNSYRSTLHADRAPSHLGSMPKSKGVDPEDRKVRLRRILDKAKKMRSIAAVSKDSRPVLATKMTVNARIYTDLATAYRKGGRAKLKWQNVYRDSDRDFRKSMQRKP